MKRIVITVLLTVMSMSALAAQPDKPVSTKKSPAIEAAMVMYDDDGSSCGGSPDTLTIIGENLMAADGSDPIVTLATYAPLTLCDASMSEVVVDMPPDPANAVAVESGDYLLSVMTSDGVGTFDLTVGAVGPVGLQGPEGPQGPAGADGTDGSDGVDGATGPAGPRGVQGEKGEPGTSQYCPDENENNCVGIAELYLSVISLEHQVFQQRGNIETLAAAHTTACQILFDLMDTIDQNNILSLDPSVCLLTLNS